MKMIGLKEEYPYNFLSPSYRHSIQIGGKRCYSLTSFLLSLSCENIHKQEKIYNAEPKEAFELSKNYNWRKSQRIFWNGERIDRHSQEYQKLLDEAFIDLYSSGGFLRALLSARYDELDYNASNDPSKTLLTKDEFISRLYKLIRRYYRESKCEIPPVFPWLKEKEEKKYKEFTIKLIRNDNNMEKILKVNLKKEENEEQIIFQIKKKLDGNNMKIISYTREITPCNDIYFIIKVGRK